MKTKRMQADPHGDLTTELERELGKLVKARHKTDFYILTRYPLAVRFAHPVMLNSDSLRSSEFGVHDCLVQVSMCSSCSIVRATTAPMLWRLVRASICSARGTPSQW